MMVAIEFVIFAPFSSWMMCLWMKTRGGFHLYQGYCRACLPPGQSHSNPCGRWRDCCVSTACLRHHHHLSVYHAACSTIYAIQHSCWSSDRACPVDCLYSHSGSNRIHSTQRCCFACLNIWGLVADNRSLPGPSLLPAPPTLCQGSLSCYCRRRRRGRSNVTIWWPARGAPDVTRLHPR